MKSRLSLLFFAVLCAASLFAQSGTIDLNGKICTVDTLACYQVGPGTLYTRFNVTIGSALHKLYLLTVDLTNPYVKIEEGQGGEHMGSTELMTTTHHRIDSAGHRPIGSVNCNFWCVSSQNVGDWEGLVNQPFAGTAKDGMLIGEPMDWNAPHGDRGYVMIDDLGKAWIRNMEWTGRLIKGTASRKIYDCNRPRVTPTNNNEICLFNRFIRTTRALPDTAIEIVFLPIDGQQWVINDTMTCIVTSINHTGRSALSGQMGALQGRGTRGTWMQNNFQVGDTFQMKLGMHSANQVPSASLQGGYTTDYNYSGDSIAPHVMQMVTGNCLVMANGDITYRNTNETYNNQNYPRTMLATNNEGNRMWLLVSEKPGNYTAEMCAMLRHDGAMWAAGMDGGGSAQMNLFGHILNPTTEATPRAVANSWFVVSTAPDDATVSKLEFVDNMPTTIASYASYAPQMRAYNQYNWLVNDDFADFTLSCEPASLGTISDDGKTFVASASGGTGFLIARCGSITASKEVTILPGTLSLRLPDVLIDGRSYEIEVNSAAGGNTYPVQPATVSWSVADESVARVSLGILTGISNGHTTVTGTLGGTTVTMNVTVEIPGSATRLAEAFTQPVNLWTPQSNYGDISWVQNSSDYPWALSFAVNSARSPQVKIVGDFNLYGLPDSMAFSFKSSVDLKNVSFTAQPASTAVAKTVAMTPVLDSEHAATIMLCPADFDADPDDIATYPLNLQAITFTLQNVKVNTPYKIELADLLVYYPATSSSLRLPDSSDSRSSRIILLDGHLFIATPSGLFTPSGQQIR